MLTLREELCLQAPDMYLKYGIQTPRGVLLWGPPGTGKTRLAAAMARRAGVPFFVVNGPDVVSSYYGYSEMGVRVGSGKKSQRLLAVQGCKALCGRSIHCDYRAS